MQEQNPYQTPPPFEVPKSDPKKLTLLAMFDHPSKAHILRNLLHDQGIETTINNELAPANFGVLAGAIRSSATEVHVFEEDAQRALEVYEAWMAGDLQETRVPEWVCRCGETVDEGFEVCWNCGAEFPE